MVQQTKRPAFHSPTPTRLYEHPERAVEVRFDGRIKASITIGEAGAVSGAQTTARGTARVADPITASVFPGLVVAPASFAAG